MHVKNDQLQDAWQKEKADSILELCLIEGRQVDPQEQRDPSSTCRSTSLRLFNCFWRELTKSCPNHLQSNSIACVKMRQNFYNYEDINDEAYVVSTVLPRTRVVIGS